jgi:hypothetical protein
VIKKLLLTAAVMAACSGAAQAATYDFSYTFDNGQGVMSGSVDGTLVGDTLTNLANLQVSFDGVAYSGTLSAGTFNGVNYTYAGTAVMSTDASKNNFIFADNTDASANNVSNFFYFFNGSTPSGVAQEVEALNLNSGQLGYDSPATGEWSLKPVPVPAALPLMISGLGLLAAAKRRRQNQAAA